MGHQPVLHTSIFGGGVKFPLEPPVGRWEHHHSWISLMRSQLFRKHPTSFRKCSTDSISCLSEHLSAPCKTNESTAKVIYSVAPAVGHNKEAHPECSSRIPAIVSALEKVELTPKVKMTTFTFNLAIHFEDDSNFNRLQLCPSFSSNFRGSEIIQLQNFRTATPEDIASVHARSYIFGLEKAMEQASEQGIIHIDGSGPTYATATTFQESLVAAGAGLSLVDSVVAASKISQNPPVGFALIRPPGHHAVPKGPMGFCIFGNVAIAARYAQRVHGLRRVFIIDFDVHHGNGTNDAFYDDPDIFFLSTHQDGSYPGTGKIDNIGCGNGEGTTLNLPLAGGSGDIAMRTVFDQVIVPSAQRFKPDIILVSAGYDGHVLDPLANFQLTTGTYYMLASSIKQLAKEMCGGRCVFFLEGGYNLKSLSTSVAESFRAFLGEPSMAAQLDEGGFLYDEPSFKVKQAIQRIKHIHSL
ncbi:Histone deacetylase domain-containing protein [Cynara cardunculus var. scolymus]|uniref:Histone deacetylase domain-containing protein n=1 Tax=Cynara cardunculus var. scolymus TaxID=59895 RepID=A0A103YFM1_CYNCS|nr:Histone deacetylase domain-containing protein [Cynara cardunculus var. scolymus]